MSKKSIALILSVVIMLSLVGCGPASEEAEDTDTENIIRKNADVIVVGTGGAGMSAAAEVVNAGGSVIVIDKMPYVGGNTILAASAMNAANPELQQKQEMGKTMLAVIQK